MKGRWHITDINGKVLAGRGRGAGKARRIAWVKWPCAVIIVACVAYLLLQAVISRPIGSCEADLDGDGIVENLVLSGNNGRLTVTSGGNEIYSIELGSLNPWKIQTADVDGDGKIEISIGVLKTTGTDPVMRKRPFIYSWGETGLRPKWLGSRLSKPFDDYIFHDLDGDGLDELISIERLADGRKVLNAYKWKGFGFEGIAESRAYDDIKDLTAHRAKNAPPEAHVLEDGKWRRVTAVYENSQLVLQ